LNVQANIIYELSKFLEWSRYGEDEGMDFWNRH